MAAARRSVRTSHEGGDVNEDRLHCQHRLHWKLLAMGPIPSSMDQRLLLMSLTDDLRWSPDLHQVGEAACSQIMAGPRHFGLSNSLVIRWPPPLSRGRRRSARRGIHQLRQLTPCRTSSLCKAHRSRRPRLPIGLMPHMRQKRRTLPRIQLFTGCPGYAHSHSSTVSSGRVISARVTERPKCRGKVAQCMLKSLGDIWRGRRAPPT
jgi:hypothetical protein